MSISDLLARQGFRIRGSRADCTHCRGTARLTVSFNDTVAYCHRCHWTANARQLQRALGETPSPENLQQKQARARIAAFEKWVNRVHAEIAAEYRYLARVAERAKQVLSRFPNCDPAWEALANFYHREAALSAQLDALSFEKVSPWLEFPSKPLVLFQKWEVANAPHY